MSAFSVPASRPHVSVRPAGDSEHNRLMDAVIDAHKRLQAAQQALDDFHGEPSGAGWRKSFVRVDVWQPTLRCRTISTTACLMCSMRKMQIRTSMIGRRSGLCTPLSMQWAHQGLHGEPPARAHRCRYQHSLSLQRCLPPLPQLRPRRQLRRVRTVLTKRARGRVTWVTVHSGSLLSSRRRRRAFRGSAVDLGRRALGAWHACKESQRAVRALSIEAHPASVTSELPCWSPQGVARS